MFQDQGEFWKIWAEDLSSEIQRVVQFAKNLGCFMDLKARKFGEEDQITLLRAGDLQIKKSINQAHIENSWKDKLKF